MSIIFVSPSRPLLVSPGRPALWRPLPGSSASGPVPVTSLSAIAGLSGWWDAGVVTGIQDPSGTDITAFNAPVGRLADKSGAGAALSVWHQATTGSRPPVATPRLNGLLGGVGLNTVVPPTLPASGQQLPMMDADQGLITSPMTLGSGASWTLFLVWSRPNWRQNNAAASTLLSINGTIVLAADNKTGSGHLVLFPGVQQTVLTASLARRHSHAVILRCTAGAGIDVWFDGTQVATQAPTPLSSSLTAPMLLLHDGTANGGAECWFHEAAVWQHALSASDIASVVGYQARWVLGPRKGVQILVNGQSNAGNGLNDGAWHLMAQGVAWHLGALAYGVVGSYGSPPAATCIHGEGIYPVAALGLSGSFLVNPGDGSSPSTWSLGADGLALQTWVQSDTDPTDAADIVAIMWPWSEDDSTRQYSEKATYEAAARRLLALERGMLSRSTTSLPQMWWSAIPFDYSNNDAGTQMQREVVRDMAADPTQNVNVVLPQTADSLPRGATLNADGTWSGGDPLHRDTIDNQRFGRLAAPLVARAVLASTGGDALTSIPAGIPTTGGPTIVHAYRQSNTIIVVTVQHDCGTDLIVPGPQAAAGTGWAVMDGGSMASPGKIRTATNCTRLSPTHLQITLALPLINPSASCTLFYPYGTATIGRGNAVTDNLAAVTPPVGWNIAADLGSAWALNMPLQSPITVTSGVAGSGIVLSDAP